MRLSFKFEREIKSFPDKKKLKEFVNTQLVLQQMLNGLLEGEGEYEHEDEEEEGGRGK